MPLSATKVLILLEFCGELIYRFIATRRDDMPTKSEKLLAECARLSIAHRKADDAAINFDLPAHKRAAADQALDVIAYREIILRQDALRSVPEGREGASFVLLAVMRTLEHMEVCDLTPDEEKQWRGLIGRAVLTVAMHLLKAESGSSAEFKEAASYWSDITSEPNDQPDRRQLLVAA